MQSQLRQYEYEDRQSLVEYKDAADCYLIGMTILY